MGNCNSTNVNCTLSDQPVSADSDVAGIGVCIRFLSREDTRSRCKMLTVGEGTSLLPAERQPGPSPL